MMNTTQQPKMSCKEELALARDACIEWQMMYARQACELQIAVAEVAELKKALTERGATKPCCGCRETK
jgi:hypothetical protein